MRTFEIKRTTKETDIAIKLNIDGTGKASINTGCGFLDHMLELFAYHGSFDLDVSCVGDAKVDYHHTTEDIAIALGTAFKNALGDKKGIMRYGDIILPMDEALVLVAIDLSGRGVYKSVFDIPTEKVGTFDTELTDEFWGGFAMNLGAALHIRQLAGDNSHHIIEGSFKAVARTLKKAVTIDDAKKDFVPSTKGIL